MRCCLASSDSSHLRKFGSQVQAYTPSETGRQACGYAEIAPGQIGAGHEDSGTLCIILDEKTINRIVKTICFNYWAACLTITMRTSEAYEMVQARCPCINVNVQGPDSMFPFEGHGSWHAFSQCFNREVKVLGLWLQFMLLMDMLCAQNSRHVWSLPEAEKWLAAEHDEIDPRAEQKVISWTSSFVPEGIIAVIIMLFMHSNVH